MGKEKFAVQTPVDCGDTIEFCGESHVSRPEVPGASEIGGHEVVPLYVHDELVLPVIQRGCCLMVSEVSRPVKPHHCILGHFQANSLLCAEVE